MFSAPGRQETATALLFAERGRLGDEQPHRPAVVTDRGEEAGRAFALLAGTDPQAPPTTPTASLGALTGLRAAPARADLAGALRAAAAAPGGAYAAVFATRLHDPENSLYPLPTSTLLRAPLLPTGRRCENV